MAFLGLFRPLRTQLPRTFSQTKWKPTSDFPHFTQKPSHVEEKPCISFFFRSQSRPFFGTTHPSGRHQKKSEIPCNRTVERRVSSMSDDVAPRETLDYDVVIVGAGPAGLSAAIKLRQLAAEKGGDDVSVCVVEKGAEVGSHILSGNVFEPRALDELIPDWRERGAPIHVEVKKDKFLFLTEKSHWSMPSPFTNDGNYIISLGQLVRWLGQEAENIGVEIFPGFSASEVLYGEGGERVEGVATKDLGVGKNGTPKKNFSRGVELRGKVTLFAEGCRGSLSEEIIKKFSLREKINAEHQTYALGIKEVWEVDKSLHSPGLVIHTIGHPLDQKTYGGGFLYHGENRQVFLGLVVALDYENPFLRPFEEFNKWKKHPSIRPFLENGSPIQYGARTLNEGGLQSVPLLSFPGGSLIGCSAGFLNVPKIKGSHTAMKSGMLAAEAVHAALTAGDEKYKKYDADVSSYDSAVRNSWIWTELKKARNIRPGFKFGLFPGVINAAFEHYISRGHSPWTLKHGKKDNEALKPANESSPISYPKPDGKISFDISTSLYRSNNNHEHSQPCHLSLKNDKIPKSVNLTIFEGPETRYCPAGVYEYVEGEGGKQELQINAQNCLHCKACDIKDPTQNIVWTVPEGGGGPGYTVM